MSVGDRRATAVLPPPPADAEYQPEPEEPPESGERASRRARGQVRRYAVENGLARLLTLTYRPPQPVDVAQVLPDVQRFLKWLRADRPDLAYVRVFERHRSGALHVHVGLSSTGRKLDPDRLARAWGRGFIEIRKIRSSRPGRREASRTVARYLSKYVVKDPVRTPGGHRYEVRQGRQPEVQRFAAASMPDGWQELVRAAGGEVPAYEWDSATTEEWTGPPVRWLSW